MKIHPNLESLIGQTPILALKRCEEKFGLKANLFAKLECMNPCGSSKDRVALKMIEEAEARGRLKPGTVIIEPTSGNTGIGLAAVAAVRGYRCIIVMPDSMSVERQLLMRAHGAELELTPGAEGMKGAIARAETLAASLPNAFIPGQFENPDNPKAHYCSTGPEIYAAMDGKIDLFVAGIGTGGTLSGTGAYLKEQDPGIRIVGVEPASSPFLSEGRAGSHGIQGIGAGFLPQNMDLSLLDEILTVEDAEAFRCGRDFALTEGLLIGISSSAALFAAMKLARREENCGKNILVLFPDSGERYLSSPMYK